jgi:hypothetical protein
VAVRLVLVNLVVASVVFCAVQDRAMADGVGRYVAAQRAAFAGIGPAVGLDEVLAPAARESVRRGLMWGGLTGAAGLTATAVAARRSRRG